jgi:hypothetical protein
MEPPPPATKEKAENPPPLNKTYFNDSTLSDLTIKLSDRSVYVHRIILCRGSEYFDKLLTGRFKVNTHPRVPQTCYVNWLSNQESDSKEVELCGDDPEAMMALLRHLYGLPYPMDTAEWHDGKSFVPHALVYTTAGKYMINKLQTEASLTMSTIVSNSRHDAVDSVESSDLLDALRVIVAGTPVSDTGGREVLLAYCVSVMRRLAQNAKFMAAVAETPALGAELIRCQYAQPHRDTPQRKSGKAPRHPTNS